MATCDVDDCDEKATVELHIPWRENQLVCSGHARVMSRKDGIVPDPIGDADDWP